MTLELAPDALVATPLIRSHGLGTLERLLDAGWQIEPPVLARLAWAQRDSQRLAYHFVLKRGSQRSLVVITDDPELQRFLTAHNLQII
jgi:hypothetical protein